MSRWTSITLANLRNAKVAALVDALNTAALGSGQTDRATEIITSVVDRIRRKIASNHSNRLDADTTTIPNGLKDDAVKLILADMKNALEMDLTAAETAEILRIGTDLNRIAAGTDTIEQPDDAITAPVESQGNIETITSSNRDDYSRGGMSGL